MRRVLVYPIVCAVGVLLATSAVAAPPVADVSLGTVQVEWQPAAEFAGMTLRVSGPVGVVEQQFAAGENPQFDLRSMESVADGLYTWEIVAAPRLDEGVRRAMAEARAAGDGAAEGRLRAGGVLPNASDMVQSGSFRVIGGSILQPTNEAEPSPNVRRVTSEATGGDIRRVTAEDQVIPDDLIVQGSLCVGFDCINNENFGFDTIRLKENNTRIKFEDTSGGSFPSTDWQLTANDSASGGQNKFSIEDITGARVPFTIEGGSTTNSIYVDSTGRVGFRTSTPVLDLHVSTTNTPAIRLEQTNAGGFTAQTWDIAGNEANFFVRDVTGGSRLPLRIRPGAPTSAIDIANDGDVGMGTTNPQQRLHIQDTTASDGPKIFFGIDSLDATVGHTIGARSDAQNVDLQAESLRNFTVIIDDDNDDTNANFLISINGDPNTDIFRAREDKRIRMNGASPSATTHPLVVGTDATDGNGAFLTAAGVWSNGSSRVNKTAIRPLDATAAFDALANLEPVLYRGKQQPDGEEYVGFIAEDVPDLVAMQDRKGLASMDIVGVLTRVVQEQQRTIALLEVRLAALEQEGAADAP